MRLLQQSIHASIHALIHALMWSLIHGIQPTRTVDRCHLTFHWRLHLFFTLMIKIANWYTDEATIWSKNPSSMHLVFLLYISTPLCWLH